MDTKKNRHVIAKRGSHRDGTTLIEVMIAAVMLAMLAIIAANAFFYPRRLVINSGREQSAIHAGSAEIERIWSMADAGTLNNAPARGEFNTDGRALQDIDFEISPVDPFDDNNWKKPPDDVSAVGGAIGDKANYIVITARVNYAEGKTVDLVTYRSLEY